MELRGQTDCNRSDQAELLKPKPKSFEMQLFPTVDCGAKFQSLSKWEQKDRKKDDFKTCGEIIFQSKRYITDFSLKDIYKLQRDINKRKCVLQ